MTYGLLRGGYARVRRHREGAPSCPRSGLARDLMNGPR